MSYVKKEFHNIKCDSCGALLDEEMWHDDVESLRSIMGENGFIEVDGKHYCQNCYHINDDDKFETKKVMDDGIYLIKKSGKTVLFTDSCNKDDCVSVGIKMGNKSVAVALKDAANGMEVSLTNALDETKYDGYIDNSDDAVADWNGNTNTSHLKLIGLGFGIKLSAVQYIPSMGELYFIFLHKKALNEALKAVGGEPIKDDCYWSSTEYTATSAGYLNFSSGTMNFITKAKYKFNVRALSAFNH